MVLELLAFVGFILSFVLVGVAIFAFWIWMIVDCVERKFKNKDDKVLWLIIILLVHVIGAIVYYFVIKIKDKWFLCRKRFK